MASVLEQYEERYVASTADFADKISKLPKAQKSVKRTLIKDLEKQAEDIRELVGHMEIESCADPALKDKVDSCKANLMRLEKELSDASIKRKSSSLKTFPDFTYLDFK